MIKAMSAVALCGLLLVGGCTEVPDLEIGECGNRIVEAGEDCDSFADEGFLCGDPGTANACLFVCSGDQTCPSQWYCGRDGRCRQPAESFALSPSSPLTLVSDDGFAVGDIDGDRYADLIGNRASQISIRFGSATGDFLEQRDLQVPEPVSPLLFLPFDSDDLLDVLVPISAGLFNLLGSDLRDFTPVSYAADDSLATVGRVRALAVEAYVDDRDLELVLLDQDGIRFLDAEPDSQVDYPGEFDIAGLGDSIAVGNVDSDPETEFVLTFVEEDRGQVFLCQGETDGDQTALTVVCPTEIEVTGDVQSAGTRFADVDGDGDLDLMLSVLDDQETPQVEVAFNNGDGNFATGQVVSFFAEVGLADDEAGNPWPLAVADFDFDNVADYVFNDKIALVSALSGGQPSEAFVAVEATTGIWNSAVITDINGGGLVDVVVNVETLEGLDAYVTVPSSGGGVSFNKFHVDTARPAALLRAGDFDGDQVGDVAFVEPAIGAGDDRISVIFGSSSGAPSAPATMGTFDSIDAIEPIVTDLSINDFDLITDLAVVSVQRDGDQSIRSATVLLGDSSRRMVSPFFLTNGEQAFDRPIGAAVGNFVDGSAGRDIVTFAVRDDAVHAWYLEGGDSAGGLVSRGVSEPLTLDGERPFDYLCATWLVGDFDSASAGDEIVGLDGRAGCDPTPGFDSVPASKAACVRRLDGLDARFAAASPLDGTCEPIMGEVEYTELRTALTSDLDGDGALDVLALFARNTAFEPGAAVIFWSGAQDRPPTVIAPPNVALYDVAVARLDSDEIPEILILAEGAIYYARLGEGRTYSPPAMLQQQDGDGRMKVSDVDGDGLDDIVYTDGNNMNILLHTPLPPVGSRSGNDTSELPVQGAGS